MASHSGCGTEAKLMLDPYSRLRSVSHTQVLISYTLGDGSQTDIAGGASILSTRVAFTMMSPHASGPSKSRPLPEARERAENSSLRGTSTPLLSLVCWTRRSSAETDRIDSQRWSAQHLN